MGDLLDSSICRSEEGSRLLAAMRHDDGRKTRSRTRDVVQLLHRLDGRFVQSHTGGMVVQWELTALCLFER